MCQANSHKRKCTGKADGPGAPYPKQIRLPAGQATGHGNCHEAGGVIVG